MIGTAWNWKSHTRIFLQYEINIYIYIYIYTTCIYIYTYMYIYIHTCIYIYNEEKHRNWAQTKQIEKKCSLTFT